MKQHETWPQRRLKKYFARLTVITTCAILFACQKENKQPIRENPLAASAKEWYYGSFKKSATWKMAPLSGKKLPDWNRGMYKKAGTIEMVEFPLVTSKKMIPVNTADLTMAERQKIAEASLSRIVFIKKQNQPFVIRELTYVPGWAYLKKKSFDINAASIENDFSDFTGRIIVRDWLGIEKARWRMVEGRRKQRLVTVSNREAVAPYRSECPSVEVCYYTQKCLEIYGTDDRFIGESCEDWELQYCELEVPELPCDDEDPNEDLDPCTGMSSDDCNCEFYGTGCGNMDGLGEDPDPCVNFECPSGLNSVPASEELFTSIGTVINQNGTQKRIDKLTWVINYSSIGAFSAPWNWKYISTEEAEAVNTGGVWKYVSIKHLDTQFSGSLPSCLEQKLAMIKAVGSLIDGGSGVKMALEFEVSVTIKCCKICHDVGETMKAQNEWVCKQI